MAKQTTRDMLIAAIAAEQTKTAPTVAPQTASKATVKTAKTAPTVAPDVLTVDGFTVTFKNGALDATIKAAILRSTKNPWYPILEWLVTQPVGYLTISKSADSKAKSPVSHIKSAIMRAIFADVKNARKLDVKSGTDKGVWYFVRRP